MAVAHNQLREVYLTLLRYVPGEKIIPLLHDLQKTKAFEVNRSFKDTVNRLLQKAKDHRMGRDI